jgi:hypothetical protein|tara:strand:- start:547 stop:1119 length:573 start_codon:yes stop_codon:yes gene_type:complete
MIDESLITPYEGTNFKVEKQNWVIDTDGNTRAVSIFSFKNKYGGYENYEPMITSYFNDCPDCNDGDEALNYNTCFNNLVYGDVLVIGLGIGTIPEYIRRNKQYATIDVVEDDQELIDYVDFLHEDINIISTSDCETYQGSKKYDLIILEYYHHTDQFNAPGTMRHNYVPQLKNSDSVMICPLINKVIENA